MRAIALLALALTACEPVAQDAPPPGGFPQTEPAIAVVDGNILPMSIVDAITSGISDDERQQFIDSPQYTEFKDGLVTQEVLYRKAIEAGAHESDDAQLLIALAAREAIVRAYMEDVGAAAITDAKVEQEYSDRAVEFRREEVSAAHILVREAAVAAEIRAKLDAGEDFAALAAQYSIDPGSKNKGGELGWFSQDRMLPEVAEPAFAGSAGDIIGPVESRVGFHIIRVDDKRDSRPLAEVRPELEESIKAAALDEFVRGLKAEAEVLYPVGEGAADHGHTHGPDGSHADGSPAHDAPAAPVDEHAGHNH